MIVIPAVDIKGTNVGFVGIEVGFKEGIFVGVTVGGIQRVDGGFGEFD